MKKLYQARDAPEADELRRFLWVRGFDVTTEGDFATDTIPAVSNRQSTLSVLVDDAEFDRASKLLVQFTNRLASRSLQSEWTCLACAEVVGQEFDSCTKCGVRRGNVASNTDSEPISRATNDLLSRDEVAAEESVSIGTKAACIPGANRSTWSVWLELITVLALTKPLWGGYSLAGFVIGILGFHSTAANFYLPAIVRTLFAAMVALVAIRLSGDSWAAFGIKKPAALDIFTGSLICVVKYGFSTVGVGIFTDILKSICSERYFYEIVHRRDPPFHVQGWSGLLLLLILAIVVGFSEELVGRAYLIPRLERLLHSTWASVLVSAAVFGLLHWPSGVLSTCHAFLAGIVYGIAFAWTRRLWPVAFAHGMYDFSAFLSDAA